MTQYDRPPSKCSAKFTLQKHPSRLASLPSTSSAAMAARRSRNMKHEDAKEGDDLSLENSEHLCTEGLRYGSLQYADDPTKESMGDDNTLGRKENKETVVGQSSMAAMWRVEN
ncbi:hypothetical protein OPV22_032654 [Ensete ventricosum]|uniref:Protein TSSC4 n=1 Tax=Ensete ventricosum TaxID=4639 RepID=A0AAV8PS29_ENSVE|nr:hypothetical protein OPV22_032654 [Ensete ventricosum]